MRAWRAIPLLLCVLLLAACGRPQGFDAGEAMSAAEMAALQASLREGKAEASQENIVDEARSCYYTVNGSVWHLDADCYHLAKSKDVLTATVGEAVAQGKTRACSYCGVIKEEKNG